MRIASIQRDFLRKICGAAVVTTLCIGAAAATHYSAGSLADPQAQADLINEANEALKVANISLRVAEETRNEALSKAREIDAHSVLTGSYQLALSDLRSLTTTARAIFDEDLIAKLLKAKNDLGEAKKKLEEAKASLQAAADQTPEVKASAARVDRKLKDFDTPPDLEGAERALSIALTEVYGAVKGLANRAAKTLAPLTTPNENALVLLTTMPQVLPSLPEAIRFVPDLESEWQNLSAALKGVIAEPAANAKPVDEAIAALKKSVAAAAGNVKARTETLTAYAKQKDADLAGLIKQVQQEPQVYGEEALTRIKEGTIIIASLDKVSRTWAALAPQLAGSELAGLDVLKAQETQQAQDEMSAAARRLSIVVGNLRDSLAGDFSKFVTERVRLYYFTDIPRIMQTLNDTAFIKGGDEAARARADELQERLDAVEAEMRLAESEVAKFKARVVEAERQLNDARADLDSASGLLRASTRRLDELNRRPEGDVSAERKARAEEEKADRQREHEEAQTRFDELNDGQQSLAAQLSEAKARLSDAQVEAERLSDRVILAARAESAAFARARDNPPYWFAPALATSPDPIKRVEISSSTGGDNTIILRGKEDDVNKVKEYIARLDEPAPQARMTLWKLELSSDATTSGTKKFNEALKIVEEELANTRARIAAALALLLDCINEEANLKVVAGGGAAKPVEGDAVRNARYRMYAQQVLYELGISTAAEVGLGDARALGLKDPAGATTLNEALIVLLLSDRDSRRNVLNRFEGRLPARLTGVTAIEKNNTSDQPRPRAAKWFARLYHVMGHDLESSTAPDINKRSMTITPAIEFTRQQSELVYAIRGKVLQRILPKLQGVQDLVDKYREAEAVAIKAPTVQNQVRLDNAKDAVQKVFRTLDLIYKEFGITPNEVLSGQVQLLESGGNTLRFKRNSKYQEHSFKPSSARVAAADGMLDAFIKAFEDDIDREFIQPMLESLTKSLGRRGVGVGVIQRTSVLATNRLVARVDPRASAELALGEEINILQALHQLSQLYLASQTGGALGVLGTFRAQAGDEKPPEVYGISTGNTFQVTPIFDPTGQALRFRFDYVGSTRIREPNGTTNPRLARIERHTVNTEVQLGNMEIREVSRFEANSKLGLPVRKSGGLPILKDIPGLRAVPVIGWFIRRSGQAAVTQQSLIFAQTTMSPTIGDILDLLDGSSSVQ